MKNLLTMILGLLLLFVASVFVASHFGGENVVLRTTDVDGSTQETRLWIQDLDQMIWLRASSPGNRWYRRLVERPVVEVKREGRWRRYRAVPVPHRTAEVNSAMALKYGWADWLIGLIRNREGAVAIRLVPAGD
jgi:hypothetical protein